MIPIPTPYKIAIATAIVAASYGAGRFHGHANTKHAWDAEKTKQAAILAELEKRQTEATVQVVTEYVDRVQVVREKAKTIIKEVPVYVPSDSNCDLGGGFRVLHDAAAANELPDPARITDAPAADAATVAETVADNYGTCHAIREQLISLQNWIKTQNEAGETQ